MNEIDKIRLGLFPVLAERSTTGHIGRTALMKYLYFLQTVRGLPLGYNFSMYSYGPFDSDVLADLGVAQSLNIVEVSPVQFAGGYGYRIKPGTRAEFAKSNAQRFLDEHSNDIDWLVSVFGTLNSAELELTSTIVYVDGECVEAKKPASMHEVTARVHDIKSHFTVEQIRRHVEALLRRGVLKATVQSSAVSN